jgi:hypothetical protein
MILLGCEPTDVEDDLDSFESLAETVAVQTSTEIPNIGSPEPVGGTIAPSLPELFKTRIRLSTTSDWTTLTLPNNVDWLNASVVWVIGEPTDAQATGEAVSLNQSFDDAVGGHLVEIMVEYDVRFPESDPSIHLQAPVIPNLNVQIERGDIGSMTLELERLVDDVSYGIEYVSWASVIGDGRNPRVVDVDLDMFVDPVGQQYAGQVIDRSTLAKKFMFGYQGWYLCPGDGSRTTSQGYQWDHWFTGLAAPSNVNVDFWPDVRELTASELCDTGLKRADGSAVHVYSNFNRRTVHRHFKWMADYGIDGVFQQRFITDISEPNHSADRTEVARHVMTGAERYGRTFAMMYDIAGQGGPGLADTLISDWKYLVDEVGLTDSHAYLHHRGKPILSIWGPGFNHVPATPEDIIPILQFFQLAPARYQATLMLGAPTDWRDLGVEPNEREGLGDRETDTLPDPLWEDIFRSFDVISPWSVGRYGDQDRAFEFAVNEILPDTTATQAHGIDYVPVVWPGFSWHNLKSDEKHYDINATPRDWGTFFWSQTANAINSGVTMLYGAMFDEIDEGTAIFKLAETADDVPFTGLAAGPAIGLDVDGYDLPSDWYLQLAGMASEMLRGEREVTDIPPIIAPLN